MQNKIQARPSKFLIRLSRLAGGALALSLVTGLFTGCGGGGGGGIATPTPGSAPTLAPLVTIMPQTPTAAAGNFQTQFGIPTVVGAQVGGPVQNVAQTLPQALTLDTFLVPAYTTGPNGAATSVKVQTARQAGLTQAELNAILQTLLTGKETVAQAAFGGKQQFLSEPLVVAGDRLFNLTFTLQGETYQTVVFQHANGTLGYNSVLFAQPGISEERELPNSQDQTNRLANDGSTVEAVVTNRNPYDGHTHYEFTVSARAAFNKQTGNATLTNPQAVVDQLGPFVSVLNGPTPPTITNAASSLGVRDSRAPSHLLQSTATFEFKYGRRVVWEIKELLKLLLHNKTVTGLTGGSG